MKKYQTLGIARRAMGGLLALALSGCAHGSPVRPSAWDTTPTPNVFWQPPDDAWPPRSPVRSPEIPDALRTRPWGVADALDVGLRNNPATQAAWAQARAAAAGYGVARAAFFPEVNVNLGGGINLLHDTSKEGTNRTATVGPAVSVSWLLLDFGGRSASLEGARQALALANWTQNATLQDTVLAIEMTYYLCLAANADLGARRQTLRETEVNLESATRRYEAGVATIADVLQAKNALSQAKLALQVVEGQVQVTRGLLATTMGLPANLSFDVEELPTTLPLDGLTQKVDELIERALAGRADLLAARSAVLASEANVRKVRSAGLPTVRLSSGAGSAYVNVSNTAAFGAGNRREDSLNAMAVLQFPLFTGYAQTFSEKQAISELDVSRARARSLEDQTAFQVFRSYYDLQTAAQKVRTVEDLLRTAEQLERVSQGRYAEGMGTILELTTAQSALADARAQGIRARWEWYTALAQLAHDTGLLGLQGETPLDPRQPRSPN